MEFSDLGQNAKKYKFTESERENTRMYKYGFRFLIVLCTLLIIALIVLIVLLVKATSANLDKNTTLANLGTNTTVSNLDTNTTLNTSQPNKTPSACKLVADGQTVDVTESDNPSVFQDLTREEIEGLTKYLYSEKSLNLSESPEFKEESTYIFSAELYMPTKVQVLDFLDKGGKQPDREAIVIIFRGGEAHPIIQEIVVGPLPVPTSYRLKQTIPFEYRPFNYPEYISDIEYLKHVVHAVAADVLSEIYGGKLKDCGNKCLAFKLPVQMSDGIIGEKKRKTWYWLSYSIEYYYLYSLDFAVLFERNGTNRRIEKVWYSGYTFENLNQFVSSYQQNKNLTKTKIEFPTDTTFSKQTLRQPSYPSKPLRNPLQFEPDGKRYTINGRHIKYFNWDFDFRMSTSFGPQLYDIRFKNERIVYEMSLQEIAAFYSANKVVHRYVDYFDSFGLLGIEAKTLVPGADCPVHATFIDGLHFREFVKFNPVKRQFCVFEHNTGEPLRRHSHPSLNDGGFYEGLESVVLILRTIILMGNYDYVVDFIFYQTGAIQVKILATGYVFTNQFSAGEENYGFQIHDNINANLHFHMFNFKVDLDIKGEQNRYETLNIAPDETENEYSTMPNAKYYQTKFSRNLKTSEKEAAYKFNFETPKYHLFYNEMQKNKYGNPKSYRILMNGMAKQLFREGSGNEPKVSWARYQLAVTKLKDNERYSGSVYSTYDSSDPIVNFEKFLEDNETIVDQDLVAWISMGMHHIPHTEDLPVTHTPGMDRSFYLLPYNYFKEDPSMASLNAIRIAPTINSGVSVERYGISEGVNCAPKFEDSEFFKDLKNNPRIMFN